jgi:four helix bundle protein
MGSIRKLRVAEDAHQLAIEVYRATENFPKPETFGLRAQMRSAAISVPSNLAEGVGRNRDGELGRFADVALGSAGELRCQVLIARDLGYLVREAADDLDERIDKVQAMLAKLARRVKHDVPSACSKRIADSG